MKNFKQLIQAISLVKVIQKMMGHKIIYYFKYYFKYFKMPTNSNMVRALLRVSIKNSATLHNSFNEGLNYINNTTMKQ